MTGVVCEGGGNKVVRPNRIDATARRNISTVNTHRVLTMCRVYISFPVLTEIL